MISERIPDIYKTSGDDYLFDRKFFAEAQKELPSINIELGSTVELDEIVDSIRITQGFLPMSPSTDCTEYDEDGWYDYYIDIFLTDNGTVVADHITAIVQSEGAQDDFAEYEIALTEKERVGIMEALDHQVQNWYGMTCEEIIREENSEDDYS